MIDFKARGIEFDFEKMVGIHPEGHRVIRLLFDSNGELMAGDFTGELYFKLDPKILEAYKIWAIEKEVLRSK